MAIQAGDCAVDVVRAGRVRLTVDDLAAELPEADVERLDDVLEVDEVGVGGEPRRLPTTTPRVLGHRRAFVLGDVSEAERELSLGREALRPHLIRADAWCYREHAAVDRRLHHRRCVVDIARREDDVGALAEQADCTRLGRCRIIALGVTGLDLKAPSADAPLRVDLFDADLRGGKRRIVERGHIAARIEGPPDHDRLLRIGGGVAARRSRDRGNRSCRSNEYRQTAPPGRPPHSASSRMSRPCSSRTYYARTRFTGWFDRSRRSFLTPFVATSRGSSCQRDPGSSPSEKISRS